MKNLMKLFALAVVVLGFSATSFGQSFAESSATTTANIIQPLTITAGDQMNFGTLIPGTTAGTVELSAEDVVSVLSGGVTILSSSSATWKSAKFTVNGAKSTLVHVQVTSGAISLTGTGLSDGVSAHNFAADCGSSFTFDGTATPKLIKVSAQLDVPAGTLPGEYKNASDLKLTVDYN